MLFEGCDETPLATKICRLLPNERSGLGVAGGYCIRGEEAALNAAAARVLPLYWTKPSAKHGKIHVHAWST
jgi:hypothetical protein